MKKITLFGAIALAVALAAAGGFSRAAHAQAKDGKSQAAATAPDNKAMMDMMMELSQPGEHHKWLDAFAGRWTATVQSWMAPGEPAKSTGTSVSKWVLGGRYLQQDYSGEWMGMPFTGLGYTGYDNVKKKYVGLWMDNMGTQVMVSEAETDAAGKVLNGWSDMEDPMTGQKARIRTVTTLIDKDHHSYEMFMNGPDGKEMKVMEINYVRKM